MSAVGDVRGPLAESSIKSCERPVIAGVCLRAARHFGLDPILVRIVMVVLTLSGLGEFTIPAYLLGMFVFSKAEGRVRAPSVGTVTLPRANRATLGWALIVVGAFVAIQQLDWIPTALLAGVAAVVIGINLVLRHSDRDTEE